VAATAVDVDGQTHLVLAERDSIGDDSVRYDAGCTAVAHEQLGPLPLETLLRIKINFRTYAARLAPFAAGAAQSQDAPAGLESYSWAKPAPGTSPPLPTGAPRTARMRAQRD
jgi:hypothetical protein